MAPLHERVESTGTHPTAPPDADVVPFPRASSGEAPAHGGSGRGEPRREASPSEGTTATASGEQPTGALAEPPRGESQP
ncbi:MAG: hypothetical protein ACODAU_01700, partial [Myxococcota bacterium]